MGKPVLESSLESFVFIGEPQIAPNAKEVIYVCTKLLLQEDRYQSSIHKIDLATRQDTVVTHGIGPNMEMVRDYSPKFSTDGSRLAFLSTRSGKPQVYVMPWTVGEPRKVTDFPNGVKSFEWAPDGKSLVVVARVAPESSSDVKVIRRLRYKLNGEGIFGDAPTHLWLVDIESGQTSQLTQGIYAAHEPAFSPDGRTIAFVSFDGQDESKLRPALYTADISTHSLHLLIEVDGVISAPSFSPDGNWIAYFGHTHGETTSYNNHLWIIPSAGGEPRNVTSALDRPVGNYVGTDARYDLSIARPVWSASSDRIYFPVTDRGNVFLFSTSLDAQLRKEIPGEEFVVSSFDVKYDTLVYILEQAASVGELRWLNHGKSVALTRYNESYLNEMSIVAPEPVEIIAEDGTAIDTWLIKPVDFEPGKKYPVVLEIHGGPHVAYGYNFHHEFQFLSSRGGRDYQDLLCVIHQVANLPFVDSNRLYVTGASYGGYMTNWLVSQTNLFRAAVAQASICNLYSKYGTSDNGFYTNKSELADAELWSDEEFIMSRSPIRYADRVTADVKIIHGELDHRCPIEQAEQWFVALKRLGNVDVEFVRFPNEHHGLATRGRPRHRVERLQHIVSWFDKHR
ncbi:S9 family peptidase [Alicyclobacillus acidiphilus]|uniref:S9 family peptidase n=1 Tax=Alicyclobacillus acidiphilus TaxID=182455 RepID=UPI00083184F7|nr:S9 family peptidase [Alicyclobacillus acidiphilus]